MQRNATVRRAIREYGELSLQDFLVLQRGRLEANAERTPMQPKEDFLQICADYVKARLGAAMAERARRALEQGALHTADHLGGLYSPQSFQGDLLFGRLLGADCVPCFAAGSVTLHSGTYARGIQYFSNARGGGRHPIFNGKQAKCAASLVDAFAESAVIRARNKTANIEEPGARDAVRRVLEEIYLQEDVLGQERFADQVTLLGAALSRRLGGCFEEKPLIYFESEEVSRELLLLDLENPDSLVSAMLFDPAVRRELEASEEPLSSILFRGSDGEGHMFPLRLGVDGQLRGRTNRGEEVCLPADRASLKEALVRRQVFVTGYLRTLMLAFARGFTWYGGIFQSDYLPRWQQATKEALDRAGRSRLCEEVAGWRTDGYISGPIFALHAVEGGEAPSDGEAASIKAVHAGPLEWAMHPPGNEKVDWLLAHTTVAEAHRMGLFEIYFDLFAPGERARDWYETIAGYAGSRTENIL